MKIFVSKSFDPADRDVNSYFERIMKALGLQVLTAEDFTGESISVRVERLLAECDFLIGIYVIRYEDSKKSKVVTSQWMMRETFTAHGQGKQFIALVEDGVNDTGGLDVDRELIFFSRGDDIKMREATVKFLQALHWFGLIHEVNDVQSV